jgi:hypothetical protein
MYTTPNTIQNKLEIKETQKKDQELTKADAKAELHTNIAYVASGHSAAEQAASTTPAHTADDLEDRYSTCQGVLQVPWTRRVDEEWVGQHR